MHFIIKIIHYLLLVLWQADVALAHDYFREIRHERQPRPLDQYTPATTVRAFSHPDRVLVTSWPRPGHILVASSSHPRRVQVLTSRRSE